MRPVLDYLADGSVHRSRDVKDAMADKFGLTDAERAEMLPSGRQRTIDNRVGWSLTYLTQAGLASATQSGGMWPSRTKDGLLSLPEPRAGRHEDVRGVSCLSGVPRPDPGKTASKATEDVTHVPAAGKILY